MSKAENNQEFIVDASSRLLQRTQIGVLKIMVDQFGLQPFQKTKYMQQKIEEVSAQQLDDLVQSINRQELSFEYACSTDSLLKTFYLEDLERAQLSLELFRKPATMTDEFKQTAVEFAIQTGRELEEYFLICKIKK